MSEWCQTADLRFIERLVTIDPGPPASGHIVKILQQRYVWRGADQKYAAVPDYEWRDVPCVTADTKGEPHA